MSEPELKFDCEWAGRKAVVRVLRDGEIIHSDTCDPSNARSRKTFTKGLLEKVPALRAVEEDEGQVGKYLLDLSAKQKKQDKTGKGESLLGKRDRVADELLAQMPQEVVAESARLLRSPHLIPEVAQDIAALGVVGEADLGLALYLTGVSRLLPKPFSVIVQGSSSSGKSHVVDSVSRLFPSPDALLKATDFSPAALYYVPPGGLMHRFVVAGERSRNEDDDRAEATRALRQIISDGALRKMLPEKGADGKLVTREIHNPGPIAYCETTTLSDFFEEDRNRCLLLASDDSSSQTRRILDAMAQGYTNARGTELEQTIAKHHAAQRLLRRVKVEIPFAPELAAKIPTDRPEARRAGHQIFSMISAVAALHQFQRGSIEPEHGSSIVATGLDYGLARSLLIDPIGRSLGGGLPDHARAFGDWLIAVYPPGIGMVFKYLDLTKREDCRWSRTSIYDHMRLLKTAGVVEVVEEHGRSQTLKVVDHLPEGGAEWLPEPEAIGLDVPQIALPPTPGGCSDNELKAL